MVKIRSEKERGYLESLDMNYNHRGRNNHHLMGSVLDTGNSYTSGRHASLMASNSTQLREGSLTGQRVNYLDSGYSEEDPDQQVTSCLMKTPSGNIFIPPSSNKPKSDYRYASSPSPTKDSLKNSSSDRDTLHYSTGVPVLPCRNNVRRPLNGSLSPSGRLHKRISGYCSWKFTAVFFIVFTLVLTAALIYVTASSFLPISYENAKACAVVVDDEDVIKSRGNELSSSNPKRAGAMKAEKRPAILSESLSSDRSRPRNLPPDGTTFNQINVKERYSQSIPPYGYWNLQFYREVDGYVTFDLSVPRGASLGLYARRNALPTHTHYDLMEIVTGFSEDKPRSVRAAKRTIDKKMSYYLVEGHWFVSIYNDDGEEQTVDFLNSPSKEMTDGCPKGCNGRGECVLGRCQCEAGFDGEDCGKSVCPMLCSGQGDYVNGECQCHPGWKGKECSLRHEECLIPDCSGHGQCKDGSCVCMLGYTGEFCDKVDCPDPTCGGHGFCVSGTCVCKKGWRGADCAELDNDARQCLPDCSSHGRFDIDSQKCSCFSGWTGEDCSLKLCDLDCGFHGRCEDTKCVCDPGWKGSRCRDKDCDPRCSLHGQCKNGTCLCVTGWNGVHCTLRGCPDECSNHGNCRAGLKGEWSCVCEDGWDGENCGIRLERRCNDGEDDDRDGLTDCQDPECCDSLECRNSPLCVTVSRPIDILLQRQPPAATASFFQKMKFIIEEGSLQRYVKNTAFNESRVAVLRGRVVAPSGRGLVGVRVSHADLHTEGYTMTQKDGWFDFMVNGGGAIALKFGKSPFPSQIRTLFAPWNEVIVIEDVVMSLDSHRKGNKNNNNRILSSSKSEVLTSRDTCPSHDYATMKPIVMTSWKLSSQAGPTDKSSLIAESRVLQESLPIPNTRTRLVHRSSRARGYLSTIQLQLTPSSGIPDSLKQIFLRITIEGVLFEKTFEADPNLKYTYSWQRLNVYRQRVFGTTTAVVKVGYSYSDCDQIIWNTQTTKISGQDLTISDIGGWDLDIHHRYNPQEGILYRGDGSNVYLKERPRLIFTVMGSHDRRASICNEDCNGTPASNQNLLSPVSIVTGCDGSVYVGDFDYVRRIKPDGTASIVLKLNSTRVEYRYHLAIHPRDGSLYVSDPEMHQIIRVENRKDLEKNWVPVIGSAIRCLPGDRSQCGDGGPAKDAMLSYPKGLAISAEGKIYFADGINIRVVNENGIVSTLIGSHEHRTHWKPLPCEGTISIEEVVLRWPTELTINPLDNTLHFIDDNMVMKVTTDGRVQIVAGRPLHCHRPKEEVLHNFAYHATLVSPQSIAFGPRGEMYVAESDSRRTNRISVVGTDGRINAFAGKESKCNCMERTCDCFSDANHLALETIFGSLSSIAAGPDDTLYVADQANERLRKIQTSIPSMTLSQEYEVYSPQTQELYVFNRFGLHTATKFIPTREVVYEFSYSVGTSNGKLVGITDRNGGKISILRDYSGKVSAIENPLRQKFILKLDRKQMLTTLRYPDNYSVSFSYYRSKELIYSRRDVDGNSFVYEYNSDGRLTAVVTPTGEVLKLSADLNIQGALVNITRGAEVTRVIMQPNSLLDKTVGHEKEIIKMDSDKSFVAESKWGHKFAVKTAPYALLKDDNGLAESFPIPYQEKTSIGRDIINRLEWHFFNKGSKMGKKLKVNGDRLLTIEMTKDGTSSQTVSIESSPSSIINVFKESGGSLKINLSPSGMFASVNLENNRLGLPMKWRWGEITREFEYDHMNRLSKIKFPSSDRGFPSQSEYFYSDDRTNEPSKITIPTGGGFSLNRDARGALMSITTPRGHIHSFGRQHSLGYRRYLYNAPWSREPYEIQYDQRGRLVAKVFPRESIKIVYAYDESGQLRSILAGTTSVSYHYFAGTALVRNIEVLDEALEFQSKTELRYHLGLLKESHTRYGGLSTILNDIYLKYQYDGSGRVATISTEIGQIVGKKQDALFNFKYDPRLGYLTVVGNIRIKRETARKTFMDDTTKNFVRIKNYDEHRRLIGISLSVDNYEHFRYRASFDSSSRISSQTISLPQNRKEEIQTLVYNANGQISKAVGVDSWIFTHDVNGNLVSIEENTNKVSLGYDSGDRVIQFGDLEFISYDERGYIVRRGEQRFTYNGLGQMIMAIEPGRFSVQFFYDDLSRLTAKRDHRGNIVQYVYSDPHKPSLLTHIHYPKIFKTHRLIYDEEDLLVSMETPEMTYYIGTDGIGSPLFVFDSRGKLVKEMYRSPFGKTQKDTDAALNLHLDFAGGLFDQYTKLIHFGQRVYDPLLGQWMTPKWENIGQNMRSPFEIFAYRFRNNDPINNGRSKIPYMTEISDWLRLFGLDLDKIMGSNYAVSSIHQPHLRHFTTDDSKSEFSVSIGMLTNKAESIKSLQNPDLLPGTSLTNMDLDLPNFSPRIATKPSSFGTGLLLSDVGGAAQVTLVDGVRGDVVQSVFGSILNASSVLDISVAGKEVFYFLKKDERSFSDDQQELERLSGSYNVTSESVRPTGKQICARNSESVVCLIYGTDERQATRHVLRSAHKTAVKRAWVREVNRVKSGFIGGISGVSKWSQAERNELVSKGEVRGYQAVEIFNVHKYPQLIGQSSNIIFLKEADAQIWRARRRKY